MTIESAARTNARRVLVWLIAVDAAVVALHVANRASGADKRLFDIELEANLPTWLSSMQFAGVALCAFLLARSAIGRTRLAWKTLAFVFGFLSLDELALLHEELVDRIARDPGGDAWYWPVFYLPIGVLALAATAVVLADVRRLRGSVAGVVAGFALLAVSLGLDSAATELVDVEWLFEPAIVLEEACELLGTALIAACLLELILARAGPGAP